MKEPVKKIAFIGMRVGVSVFILFTIATRINIQTFFSALEVINIGFLSCALGMVAVGIFFSAGQLKTILSSVKVERSFRELLAINLIAYFYSFLGQVSGGFVRWLAISGSDKRRGEAVFSIAVEKVQLIIVSGVFIFVGMCANGFTRLSSQEKVVFLVMGLFLAVVIFLFCALVSHSQVPRFLRAIFEQDTKDNKRGYLKKKLLDISRVLESFQMRRTLFLKSLIFAAMYQGAGLIASSYITRSVGVDIPFFGVMWIFPLTLLVVMMPVSIYGLGVREGVLIFFLSKYGVTQEQGLLIGLLIFFTGILQGMAGGLVELAKILSFSKSKPA